MLLDPIQCFCDIRLIRKFQSFIVSHSVLEYDIMKSFIIICILSFAYANQEPIESEGLVQQVFNYIRNQPSLAAKLEVSMIIFTIFKSELQSVRLKMTPP